MLNRLGTFASALSAGYLDKEAQKSQPMSLLNEEPLPVPDASTFGEASSDAVVDGAPKTLSTKMSQVAAPYNKYSSIISTDTSFAPPKQESLYEQVFGRQPTEFELLKESFLASQTQKASARHQRFG